MKTLDRFAETDLLLPALEEFLTPFYPRKSTPVGSEFKDENLPPEVLFLERCGQQWPRVHADWRTWGVIWPFQINELKNELLIIGPENFPEVGYVIDEESNWNFCRRFGGSLGEWEPINGDPAEYWVSVWLSCLSYRSPHQDLEEDKWENLIPNQIPLWSGGSSGIWKTVEERPSDTDHKIVFYFNDETKELHSKKSWNFTIREGDVLEAATRKISKLNA